MLRSYKFWRDAIDQDLPFFSRSNYAITLNHKKYLPKFILNSVQDMLKGKRKISEKKLFQLFFSQIPNRFEIKADWSILHPTVTFVEMMDWIKKEEGNINKHNFFLTK